MLCLEHPTKFTYQDVSRAIVHDVDMLSFASRPVRFKIIVQCTDGDELYYHRYYIDGSALETAARMSAMLCNTLNVISVSLVGKARDGASTCFFRFVNVFALAPLS